jgi:sporulation protein YlmC with PRC-barrel domain
MKVPQKALLLVAAGVFCLANATGSFGLLSKPVSDPNLDSAGPEMISSRRKSNSRPSLTLEKDRVRNLCGMTVENRDGQSLGRLEDFVVDRQSGRVIYALFSSGGILGVRKHLKLTPPELLTAATAKKGVLELDVGRKRWQHAPHFRTADLAAVGQPNEIERIYGYYGQSFQRSTSPKDAAGTVTIEAHSTSAKGKTSNTPSVARPAFATAVMGKSVYNRQQETIGEISDLLVDLKGRKPTLAIISPNKMWNEGGTFAVPVGMLTERDGDSWALDANRRMFSEAPSLDEESWQTTDGKGTKVIYRYEDLEEAKRRASQSLRSWRFVDFAQALPYNSLGVRLW